MKHIIAIVYILLLGWCQTTRAQNAGLVTVIVSGSGSDVSSAKKDAYRTAVEQVVGSILVEAETLVENDDLIKDQVLTYSSAYVESAEVLGDPVSLPGGLVRVRVKASVRKKKLEDKLRIARTATAPVEGESLFAEMVSRKNQWTDATGVIRSVFEDFPLKVLTVRVLENARGKTAFELDQKTGEVIVPVCIYVDEERYRRAVNEIRAKIGPMSLKATPTVRKQGDTDAPDLKGGNDIFYGYSFCGIPDISNQPRKRYLLVCEDLPSRKGVFYEFDINHFSEIQRYFARADEATIPARLLVAEIAISDSNGNEICKRSTIVNASDDFPECHAFVLDHDERGIVLAPLPVISSWTMYKFWTDEKCVELQIPKVPRDGCSPSDFVLKGNRLFMKISLGVIPPEDLRIATRIKANLKLIEENESPNSDDPFSNFEDLSVPPESPNSDDPFSNFGDSSASPW